MNVFRYLDYREVLALSFENLKKRGLRVNYEMIAEAVGVQKTYVSRVLRKQSHFSADQLFLVCKFLHFTAEESEYLSLLVEYERAGVKERKKNLLAEIQRRQNEKTKIQANSKATMVESVGSEQYLEYYMDPRAPLVHTYFNIESFRRQPDQIRQALNMSENQFKRTLQILEKASIIKWNATKAIYELKIEHLHLTKDSPLSFPAEQLTRMMVIDHLKKLTADQKFYYSFTFSADEKTRAFLHQEFLKFLRVVEPEIRRAPSEEIFHMSFDLFPWMVDR